MGSIGEIKRTRARVKRGLRRTKRSAAPKGMTISVTTQRKGGRNDRRVGFTARACVGGGKRCALSGPAVSTPTKAIRAAVRNLLPKIG